jgi:hypothetical protein
MKFLNYLGSLVVFIFGSVFAQTYDGYWLGSTEQGELIGFQIENGGVLDISVGFDLPGCEGDSPRNIAFGTPEHFVKDGSLEMTLEGLYAMTIEGTFTSADTVSGTLDIKASSTPCKQGLSTTWTATSNREVPPQLSPELAARLPETKVPNELVLPEAGSDNFYELGMITSVLGQQGDWFLVQNFDSIYPVPSGWTIFGNGKEDAVVLFSKGGIQLESDSQGGVKRNKPVEIYIQVGGVAGMDYQALKKIKADFEAQVGQTPSISFYIWQSVDENKAYLFLEAENDEGGSNRLMVFSRTADGFFRTLTFVASSQDWQTYYPVIQAMAENWTSSSDGSLLGVPLPETIAH